MIEEYQFFKLIKFVENDKFSTLRCFFFLETGIEKQKYVDTCKVFIHSQRNIFGNENKKDILAYKNTNDICKLQSISCRLLEMI